MKKQFFRFTFFLLVCLTFSTHNVGAQTVNIPDPNLRAAIETALGKASGATITAVEMATLTRLDASNANIRVLTGLEVATNLTRLVLHDNPISDISPVAGLTNLTVLGLGGNSLSDISFVAGLTNLTVLALRDNSISDISPLVANTGLGGGDWVDVRENPLSYLSIHTHIPTLTGREVAVEFDNFSDATVDIPDPNLRAAIETALGKAPGATITAVEMATLTRLEAREANIRVLTGLEFATNLTRLVLHDNSISDISSVVGLTNLTVLALRDNSISDISPLVANTGLGGGDWVDVRENPLSYPSTRTSQPSLAEGWR